MEVGPEYTTSVFWGRYCSCSSLSLVVEDDAFFFLLLSLSLESTSSDS